MRRIPCPVSAEELDALYRVQKLTDGEIAALLPGGTKKRVLSWRQYFNIPTLPRWGRHDPPLIQDDLQSLLVGSMLGDGRIVFRVRASLYDERHSDAQKAYLKWKADHWGSWSSGELSPTTWRLNEKVFQGWIFRTVAHPMLNEWRDLFYASRQKGWKQLLPRIVDLVDAKALAIWYLDDGTPGWWPHISFGADEPSRQVAFSIFEKFGFSPSWLPQKDRGDTGSFCFKGEQQAEAFIDVITPHVPECMLRKLQGFGFKGPHYQVRQKIPETRLRLLVDSGFSVCQIAEALGVGETTVRRRLVDFGIRWEK